MLSKYRTLIILGAEIAVVLCLIISLIAIRGCGVSPGDDDDSSGCKENQVRWLDCPSGQAGRRSEICEGGSWKPAFTDCKAASCSETVFDRDIKPVISANCVSCHSGFDSYDTAKGKIDAFITRTANDEMPKPPNTPLSPEDKAKLTKWKADGLLPSCPDQASNPPLDYDYIESAIETDLNEQTSSSLNEEAIYIVSTHKSDEGASNRELEAFKRGLDKNVNQLSSARQIILGTPIDQYKTIYRYYLKDLKLNADDWRLIEDNDPIDLESFTNRGILIKQLTKKRKAWLLADGFVTSSNQAAVYYQLRRLPSTARELFTQLGVEFDQDLIDFEALFVGVVTTSPISLGKNRLLSRHDSNDGYLWITFDVALGNANNTNLLQFPLLKSASGQANFLPNASEFIFTLQNGLDGYFLSDATGKRQNFAPTNIVAHNIKPPQNPEIRIASSCSRCHNAGIIDARDEVLSHVVANASNFDLRDVEFVEQFYRDPQPVIEADRNEYAASLAKMGISADDPDPISLISDNLLERNHTAKSYASFLLLTEEEFIACLSRSAEAREQVGALLNGGQITPDQLLISLPILRRDCRIGQNPL